jgi:two-component system, chemotaxis family, sensor kinase CheA
MKTWRIRFEPNRELLLCGSNPISLLNELRGLGRLSRSPPILMPFRPLTPWSAEHCYLYWDIVLTTSRGEAAIKDVFIFVEDDCRISIELIDDTRSGRRRPATKKAGRNPGRAR